ncbi:prevent-host-death protein [Devosia insulae DS-56]|uniref:Antitoxin n=1 Tax=Devosia insulae DS-56 TaxID=1116389 RepID=A0A1E5XI18_9HYPH|nr:type II toxin-antitoxin system Phd/YefM family antitoxin [Devosia insulae]OEO28248.1 prevent-host-death protein [Devosia insulae DS-56]
MSTVNIHDAKTHFSRLVERAANGETVIIAKAGKPIAKLVPLEQPVVDTSKRFGGLRGQFKIPDDFDRMMEDEIAEMFNGK